MRQFHVLHLEALHLHTPRGGGAADILAQQVVDLVSLLQDFVEIMLSDGVAQTRQRQLIDRPGSVRDRNNRFGRVRYPIPQYRVELYGDAIARDGFLLLGGHGPGADVDHHRSIDSEGNDPKQPGPLQANITTQAKYNATLIFLRDAKS